MAAVTDFANPAAAVTAGYSKTQLDRGVPNSHDINPAPRYATLFEKSLTGCGQSGESKVVGYGESNASAAAADTQATTALNAVRRHAYGGSPGRASGESDSPNEFGQTQTIDVT